MAGSRGEPVGKERQRREAPGNGLPLTTGHDNDPAAELAVSARRRSLLTGGLALVSVIVVAGSFVYRAVNCELGVAACNRTS
jgi:hypothetical protein